MLSITDRACIELIRTAKDSGLLMKRLMVRVGVKGGGCSGLSYTMGFEDTVREDDMTFDHGPVYIVCDPKSFLYLNGIEIDFEESLMGRGFKFNNPNARGSCGCGESFNV